ATPPKAQKADSTKKTTAGVSLDFQDQELRVVLDALAAAGDLNVSMTNIPSQRVSLHMGRPVTREGMIELVKSVAESNGLKVTETPTLMQIAGPQPAAETRQSAAQQLLQQQLAQNQQQQVRLYTYRLKHASAVQLAPVLTNLFSGLSGNFGGGRGTTIIPNANGGFQVFTPATPDRPPGNITTIQTPFAGNAGRGNAGRGGAGNPNAAGGIGNVVTNALGNALAQAAGLSSQSGDIRIIAEETSNSLLVRATDADWALVQQIIQGVDLRPLQVLIEVTIAEVQRTHDLDLGVSGTVKRIPNGKTAADVTATAPSQASARDFIVELTGGHGTINYDVAIAALQERGDVRVLSLPVIIAQNNRQAVLNVGSSRPFVQVSQTVPNDPTGRVQTVQYIDVATTLTITPTINPDGYVNLQVSQTDNSATNEVQFDAPVINKREATTQIFIRDGQTTVIGGLADNTKSSDVSGIPFLSRIPLLGPFLFGRVTKNETTNELFLFLTPHIISSDTDIDRLRDALRDGSDLLKQIDVGPRIIPRADTLPLPTRPDTVKKPDSLTTLRRRPPEPR
ncbi:MAG TPA: secretin N-terminal domain-containing protein, partial [Gemmatimonadaceae bacterium]|nr:secretin N-terminal domain-containing protein [Gemmatimonadaceae bacterium]